MKEITRIITNGRGEDYGIVNPPVYRASTVLFPTVEDLEKASLPGHDRRFTYGRNGTPTIWALEDAIIDLEDGHACTLLSSGLAAITTALFSFLKSGDHLLMVDSTYGPTRRFCDETLADLGVETTYYDPLIGKKISSLMQPNTRVVFLESPGSQTFEIQDTPAITSVVKESDAITIMDNTWATPHYFKPLANGVDVSVLSATKYIVGHADAMLGSITTTRSVWDMVHRSFRNLGGYANPDDCYLALRGLRTLPVRLAQHHKSGLQIARWLTKRPEVSRVLYPPLEDDPGHEIWRRDFKGASSLFGVVLEPCSKKSLHLFLNSLKIFGMGYSWGGYESLIVPTNPAKGRTATMWDDTKPSLRFHIGLEDPSDLINDLENCFSLMAKSKG